MRSELIVLSHLRWDWVWQRPQQIISRMAADPELRIWFVEEPVAVASDAEPTLVTEEAGGITRVWLQIPDPGHYVGYTDEMIKHYVRQLPELLGPAEAERVAWLYTPLALEAAFALEPRTVVYDVMDDLAAFKGAAPELVLRRRQALRAADIVFAGGRSLHRSLVAQGRDDALLEPSGVSADHYAPAGPRHPDDRTRTVAGYVGVLDERLDLDLVAGLADALPDWTIRMIGPVTKIDPSDLPVRSNIEYMGMQEYDDLPGLMAELDVALMPFALNEATRSISPTKTLEYLAAGLPVVSTRIADVVADFGDLVAFGDDAAQFADACRQALHRRPADRDEAKRVVALSDWDAIAERMAVAVFGRRLPRIDSAVSEA